VEYVGSLLEKFAPPRAQRSPEQHICPPWMAQGISSDSASSFRRSG